MSVHACAGQDLPSTSHAQLHHSISSDERKRWLPSTHRARTCDTTLHLSPDILQNPQALRLHQEHHLARHVNLICRVPAMRYAPLKELTRLAANLKETSYSKGTSVSSDAVCRRQIVGLSTRARHAGSHVNGYILPNSKQARITNERCVCALCVVLTVCPPAPAGQTILRQGQEVSDIHFILSGSVHLTYSAAIAQTAAAAAQRASCVGAATGGAHVAAAAAAAGGVTADAAAAAKGRRASSGGRFSELAQALKLEQTCFEPPVVMATR